MSSIKKHHGFTVFTLLVTLLFLGVFILIVAALTSQQEAPLDGTSNTALETGLEEGFDDGTVVAGADAATDDTLLDEEMEAVVAAARQGDLEACAKLGLNDENSCQYVDVQQQIFANIRARDLAACDNLDEEAFVEACKVAVQVAIDEDNATTEEEVALPVDEFLLQEAALAPEEDLDLILEEQGQEDLSIEQLNQ